MSNYVRKECKSDLMINHYFDEKNRFHRLDGPALEFLCIDKYLWYINGQRMAEEDWKKHPMVICYNLGKIMKEVLEEV